MGRDLTRVLRRPVELAGVKQPCRRNPETAEVDPNRTSARGRRTVQRSPHLGVERGGDSHPYSEQSKPFVDVSAFFAAKCPQ